MSCRGGGWRPEGRPDQRNPAQSFQRGGGDGGGRGRGGGACGGGGLGCRSGGFPAPSPSELSYPPLSRPSASPQFPRASSHVPVPSGSQLWSTSTAGDHLASSSSTSVATLSREVEKIALQSANPASALAVNLPPASIKLLKPQPARPGFGTVGQKVITRANHFLVDVVENDLHHYDVAITPEVTSKKVKRDVINELVRLYKESHLGKRNPAYDGGKSLYTAGSLPFTSMEFVIKLVDKDNKAGSAREREFRVAIKFAAKADLHYLQQFLHGRQQEALQQTIQFLDVVLREAPSNKYTAVGRSIFPCDLGPTGEHGDGLEYWRGFYQSLRPTQMGLSLNIDVSARSFYEPILVTQFVAKYLNVRELARPLSDRDRVKVAKALKGLKVEISYREYVKRYKVTGVSVQPTNQLMFSDDEGNQISVAQYFRERYSIVLRYPMLPSLQAGNGAVYLPMELCTMVKGQRYTKKMTEKQVTALLRATCQRPQMVRQNNYNCNDPLNKEFGIEVKDDLTVVNARVIPSPRFKYYHSGRDTSVDPHVGQWNMMNKKMVHGGTLEYWTCISFSSQMLPDMVSQFCGDLVSMCSSKGMAFNPNPLLPINTSHPDQLERALLDVHLQSIAKLASMAQSDKRLQLLIIILPDVSGSYVRIKQICENILGIFTQCCQPCQAQKLSKQYLENLSLKINAKMVASMDWPEVTKYRGLDNMKMDRSGNILLGTVVDTKICHPTEFDFNLNRRTGIQGTSRPSHYAVLYDFSADQLQMLTDNNLSFTILAKAASVDEIVANNNKEEVDVTSLEGLPNDVTYIVNGSVFVVPDNYPLWYMGCSNCYHAINATYLQPITCPNCPAENTHAIPRCRVNVHLHDHSGHIIGTFYGPAAELVIGYTAEDLMTIAADNGPDADLMTIVNMDQILSQAFQVRPSLVNKNGELKRQFTLSFPVNVASSSKEGGASSSQIHEVQKEVAEEDVYKVTNEKNSPGAEGSGSTNSTLKKGLEAIDGEEIVPSGSRPAAGSESCAKPQESCSEARKELDEIVEGKRDEQS